MYRIDIKNDKYKSIRLYQILRIFMACYIVGASVFLFYKVESRLHTSWTSGKEWAAIGVNLLIIFLLARQLLITDNRKFIFVTDQFVKYRLRFPWVYQLNWQKVKTIQFGYSSVRFITNSQRKHRFFLHNATEEEKKQLKETLSEIAAKQGIQFMEPT